MRTMIMMVMMMMMMMMMVMIDGHDYDDDDGDRDVYDDDCTHNGNALHVSDYWSTHSSSLVLLSSSSSLWLLI